MKKPISTEKEITNFLNEKIQKAGHHAQNVKYVVHALWGVVQMFGENITAKFDDEKHFGNLLWFTLNGEPYCLAYNHKTLMIELRDRSQRGESIKNFDNSTPNDEIFSIFSVLSTNLKLQTV